eukprot:4766403-Prymnesium_polylepis.2
MALRALSCRSVDSHACRFACEKGRQRNEYCHRGRDDPEPPSLPATPDRLPRKRGGRQACHFAVRPAIQLCGLSCTARATPHGKHIPGVSR